MSREMKLKDKIALLSASDVDRLIRMGWEDRTAFEAISLQFGFTENEFVRLMRSQLSTAAFNRWRRRVHDQGRLKHERKSGIVSERFKCSRQSVDGITKGWK